MIQNSKLKIQNSKLNLVEPDRKFIKQIMELGGESLKKCYQCAACSVVCNLSLDNKPFPRKEMIWAQWGLKDKLLKDPDVWLCHQCNDCSIYCPRGAEPGDVLAAIRNYSFMHYAFPKFMGKTMGNIKYLSFLFAIPIILLMTVLSITGKLTAPPGEIVYSKFIPHIYIEIIFLTFSGLALVSAVIGLWKFWRNINENSNPGNPLKVQGKGSLWNGIFSASTEILRHNKFKDCKVNKMGYYAHLAVFYGFIGLGITTTAVFLGIYLFEKNPPWPLSSWVKILGNLSALALFIGCTIHIYRRLLEKDKAGKSNYYDWVFIWVLYATTISGILTEVARLVDMAILAYSLYLAHLMFIFFLLAYAPYSKFAHLIYRTVAMVYSKSMIRDSLIR